MDEYPHHFFKTGINVNSLRQFLHNKPYTMQSVWLSIIVVTLPPTLYSIAVDEFYPFGYENGDAKMELRGDVVSSPIAFPSTFNYFTAGHNRCYVSIIFNFLMPLRM